MRKIKIAYILYELSAGGQEKQMSLAIKALSDNNIKPILFIWSGDKKITQDYNLFSIGIKIIQLKGSFLSKIFQIRKEIKAKKVAILQSWSILMNFITYLSTINIGTHSIGALRSRLYGKYLDKKNIIDSLKIIPQLLFTKNIICNNDLGVSELKNWYHRIFCIYFYSICYHKNVSKDYKGSYA